MLELLVYISYSVGLLVWMILSFLLVRHIQALMEIRGVIRIAVISYFALCLVLIGFSFFSLFGLSFENIGSGGGEAPTPSVRL